MQNLRSFALLSAAAVSGALAMVAQTLLLQRFLWRFESAETGVALFLSSWLFWSGTGAALASTSCGNRITATLARCAWLPIALCAVLYFVQYSLIENLRGWMGVPEYQTFPLIHLILGCMIANVPFCIIAGWMVPTICQGLTQVSVPISRAFAWEALGAAAGGAGLLAVLIMGGVLDPRDQSEWSRYFPLAPERPGRFVTGGGTTFYGSHGNTFYALSSSGVSEVIPEGDRAMELAVLALSQRPYAKRVMLLGHIPLAAGFALERLRPDLSIVWCPCDAAYGVKMLEVAGTQTKVQAAGESPQRFLTRQVDGAFDVVMVMPPSAASLAGAAWRETDFVREVRRVTQRTGAALFGLDCDVVLLLPEKAALLDATLRPVRQVWPEDGCFIPSAGGWWVAAQVPRLAYSGETAAMRFALLKRQAMFPTEAVARLYDPERAQRLIRQCPVLDQSIAVLLPDAMTAEEILVVGLADAIREAYPDSTPALWFAKIKAYDGPRIIGLLLVVLWMMPVMLGLQKTASRRLLAAWLAACGALGLVASLAILYRLQMKFGSLYLLAGAGSCLYLGGLFCGNRMSEVILHFVNQHLRFLRGAILAATGAQAVAAIGVIHGSECVTSAMSVVGFCFVAGFTAGACVPLALAAAEQLSLQNAAVFVLADAFGAAVAGLLFMLLVPFTGIMGTVACFAVLACGLSVCVTLSGPYARLTSGLSLIVALAILGGHFREMWQDSRLPAPIQSEHAAAPNIGGALDKQPLADTPIRGIPRKVDESVIRAQIKDGRLSAHPAAFCE